MNQVKVSLIKCADYNNQAIRSAILRHFELHGGIESFVSRGDSVLIKPNMIAPKPRECATQTDPVMIVELARILVDCGAKPFVADSPAWANITACAKVLGLVEPLKKLGVPIKQLDNPVKRRLELSGVRVGISRYAIEADKIINLPKLKTHQQLGATIAVKNMFGCVSGKAKAVWHFKKGGSFDDFCTILLDIYRFLSPVITIIDAVEAMDGPGPINGNARHFGWTIAAVDPLAAEVVCCGLMGFSTEQLPIITTARKKGVGCTQKEQIDVVGDNLPAECVNFIPAELVPLRFSFPRIIKSIVRQIFILAKSSRHS